MTIIPREHPSAGRGRGSIFSFILAAAVAGSFSTAALAEPKASTDDMAAITQVLTNYRTAVSTGDEALFSGTILDDEIPFFALRDSVMPPVTGSSDLRNVKSFRQSVFGSGRKYQQSFDNIKIRRDGGLAQVSLHFVTRVDGGGGEGWKTLALMKVAGHWKIASEFYTVRSLNVSTSSRKPKDD